MATPTRDPSKPWYAVQDAAHKALIERELKRFGGFTAEMATHLGIGQRTLYREAERLGVALPSASAVTKNVTKTRK